MSTFAKDDNINLIPLLGKISGPGPLRYLLLQEFTLNNDRLNMPTTHSECLCLSIDLQLPKYIVFKFNIVILSILNFKAIKCITNIQIIVQINNQYIVHKKYPARSYVSGNECRTGHQQFNGHDSSDGTNPSFSIFSLNLRKSLLFVKYLTH